MVQRPTPRDVRRAPTRDARCGSTGDAGRDTRTRDEDPATDEIHHVRPADAHAGLAPSRRARRAADEAAAYLAARRRRLRRARRAAERG